MKTPATEMVNFISKPGVFFSRMIYELYILCGMSPTHIIGASDLAINEALEGFLGIWGYWQNIFRDMGYFFFFFFMACFARSVYNEQQLHISWHVHQYNLIFL